MSSLCQLQLPASPSGLGLPGSWTLARDRAVTLDPRQAGFLRVAHGVVWATLIGPHQGPANDWGDVVLRNGARIHLAPGQHVVLESFPAAANEDACFSWEPDPVQPESSDPATRTAWRRLLAFLDRANASLGRWPRLGASWPKNRVLAHDLARDRASHTLFHLGINQP